MNQNNSRGKRGTMSKLSLAFGWILLSLLGSQILPAAAEGYSVGLTEDKPYIHVIHEGKSVRIARIQDPNFELRGYYAKTARKCPPFCLKPMHAAPGVETIGEVELFDFMEGPLRDGTGLLIDARTPAWHTKGTIPGAVSYPFTLLTKPADDPVWDKILPKFGVVPARNTGLWEQILEKLGLREKRKVRGKWDFTHAKELVLFCNGPACGQSPRAIRGLVAIGYPPEKIRYYRGGMQMWEIWGLTTVKPKSSGKPER